MAGDTMMQHGLFAPEALPSDVAAIHAEEGGATPAPALCHQKAVKESRRGMGWSPSDNSLSTATIVRLPFPQAKRFILEYEWLGTMPSGFRAAYALQWEGNIGCVVVCGSPNPMQIAKSMYGGRHTDRIMQVHRGASTWWAHQHSASFLLGATARLLRADGWAALVAFSDPMAGEIGTVYQASNWRYCGLTAKRPDYYTADGKRMVGHFAVGGLLKRPRPRKHRYVLLLDKDTLPDFQWPDLPYPKREGLRP